MSRSDKLIKQKRGGSVPCSDSLAVDPFDYGGLPVYQCHKIVGALKIARVIPIRHSECASPERYLLCFEEDRYPDREVASEWICNHRPEAGGYFVLYKDGYESYSPAKAFEEGYVRI